MGILAGDRHDPSADDAVCAVRVLRFGRLWTGDQSRECVVYARRLRHHLDHRAARLRRRRANGRLGLQFCGIWA